MVFHWRLSDRKSHQISRTLLRILAVFKNAVVWMIFTRPPTSKSSRPFNNPLVTVPNAPITIGIIVTFIFHSFFQFSSKVEVLISLFTFFQFYSAVSRDSKVDNFADFFLLIIITSGLRAEIRWSLCISKSHRSLCVSFSRTGAGLCIYHLLAWSDLNFLHISQWITLPTQSCLALYSFCANLLYSLIMWLMGLSLSSHSLHLLFCCVLSILALIWWVLMALFCTAVRRDSVSLWKFPFLRHVQVLSWEMLFISRLKRPWSCFPSHFCFLVFVILLSIVLSVLFLMAVISPRSCFSMLSSSRCIDVSTLSSMLASPLPPSFLNNPLVTVPKAPITISIIVTFIFHSLFNVHVITFLVLWSICPLWSTWERVPSI